LKPSTAIETLEVVNEYLLAIRKNGVRAQRLLVTTATQKQKMEVIVAGNGPSVLLISGFGLTASQWFYQLAEWSSKYQLIVIHIPGTGLSEAGSDLSFSGLGKLFREVLHELNAQWPVHVTATSWGGILARSLAWEYPQDIASLTLACSFTRVNSGDSRELTLRERVKLDFDSQDNQSHGYQLIRKSEHIDPAIAAKYYEFINGDTLPFDAPDVISTPTLVVAGSKDRVINPEESRIIHKNIRNSQYFEIPEAGHSPYITHYREFNQRVSKFIDECENYLNKEEN